MARWGQEAIEADLWDGIRGRERCVPARRGKACRRPGPASRALLIPSILAATLVQVGPAAWAQEPSTPRQIELAVFQSPPIVLPEPDLQVAQQDAEEALAQMRARERALEVVQEVVRFPDRRPDLQRDVVQGIQARAIQDALRRR